MTESRTVPDTAEVIIALSSQIDQSWPMPFLTGTRRALPLPLLVPSRIDVWKGDSNGITALRTLRNSAVLVQCGHHLCNFIFQRILAQTCEAMII